MEFAPPEKFDDDLGNFQHVGMVVNVNPVEIVHAGSVAGRVIKDTGMGKWAYWGKLKNVNYQGKRRSILISQIPRMPQSGLLTSPETR